MPTDQTPTIEQRLRNASRAGEWVRFNEGDHIPAALIVELVTTDTNAVHAKGIQIENATIDGALDFAERTITRTLLLLGCRIPKDVVLRDARTRNILLVDCIIEGDVRASRARIDGTLRLSGTIVSGTVELVEACITNEMDFSRASFGTSNGQDALIADGLKTGGGAYLREHFTATGTVRFLGSDIGGDLDFSNADINGNGADALKCNRAVVAGAIFMEKGFLAKGLINLCYAQIGVLVDDREAWPIALNLSGFTYGNLGTAGAKLDAKARIDWLQRQDHTHFNPQPYEQLAKVFKEMGRLWDYRDIHIAKEWARLNYKKRRRAEQADNGFLEHITNWASIVWGYLLGITAGFGYKPWRVLPLMAVMIAFGVVVFQDADRHHMMVPAKERVYMDQKPLPPEYPRFNALMYSMDVFFPILDLHQENYWMPAIKASKPESETNGDKAFGRVARVYMWIHIFFGWFLTALGVAGITGLVKKEQ